jgi:hypothetical protein
MNHFDYLSSINDTKKDIMVDDIAEKQYNSFMVNRGLSYFHDTALIANEMNMHAHLDKKMQYHFLLNIIRKRKRFSKWAKPEKEDNIQVVKTYYGYSEEKARQALELLTEEQIEVLKKRTYTGGAKK